MGEPVIIGGEDYPATDPMARKIIDYPASAREPNCQACANSSGQPRAIQAARDGLILAIELVDHGGLHF
jgi:hypothetical protein